MKLRFTPLQLLVLPSLDRISPVPRVCQSEQFSARRKAREISTISTSTGTVVVLQCCSGGGGKEQAPSVERVYLLIRVGEIHTSVQCTSEQRLWEQGDQRSEKNMATESIVNGVLGAAETATSMSASGPAVIVLLACLMGLAFATFLWTLVAQVKVGEDKLSSTAALLPSNASSTHRCVSASERERDHG